MKHFNTTLPARPSRYYSVGTSLLPKAGRLAALLGLSIVLLVGCSDNDEADGAKPVADNGSGGGQTTAGDVAGNTPDTLSKGDAPGDSVGPIPDTSETGLPEDFKTSCEDNSNCSTGFCIDSPEGTICTIPCIETCPGGFSCQGVTNTGGDVTYICVPTWKAQCSECENDADCGAENTRCELIEGEGKRCSRECSSADPCPDDYLCQALDDLINLCRPATGSCICTPDLLGEQVECGNKNNFGECFGSQICGGPGGFTDCTAKVPAPETCNAKDDDCDGDIDDNLGGEMCVTTNDLGSCAGEITCFGADGLGCNAPEPAVESCDGIDNDCDGKTDEQDATGCTVFYEDKDKDSLGSALSVKCLCGAEGDFNATGAGDCHDLDPTIGTGQIESCNGNDDDCDGLIDEPDSVGCTEYFHDGDGDGFGVAGDVSCLCTPSAPYTAPVGGDCQDDNGLAYPGQTEICNDGDDNCNGITNEEDAIGCTPYLQDADSDGFGVTGLAKCLCSPGEIYKALAGNDCADDDEFTSPIALEICDGFDNSCNGIVDEECDKDSDGYCNASKPIVGNPAVCPLGGGDCVDWDANINPGATEQCDTVDNNCDGSTDEGVLAPCGGCAAVCLMGAGPQSDEPFADEGEFFDGAGTDEEGNIVLDTSSVQLDMIWISNSGEGSVSKINTSTGNEVARYQLCNDPSRTAVDSLGNAWIGCRGDARVVKVALATEDCPDKNGDGVVQTSTDLNGDGIIQPETEMFGELDECILVTVNPDGTDGKARALGIDKDDNPWVGMWNTQRLWKLDGQTGAVLQKIDLPHKSYGLAIDQEGIIWLAGREGKVLVRVDPKTGSIQSFSGGATYEPYGITIDENGRIWTANCCGEHAAYRFDPTDNTFAKAAMMPRGRGIASNGNGYVFVANDQSDRVAKIDVNTMEVVGYAELGEGRFPVGMAVDFDGMVWAVNQSTSSATRIHPDTLELLTEKPTGPSPYTYSDMTGFQQRTIVAPKGTYRHVFKGWQGNETQWMQVGLELTTPDGTSAQLRVRTAESPETLDDAVWTPIFGPFPPTLPTVNLSGFGAVIGRYLEVEVTLFAENSTATPILKSVDVVAAEFQ